MSAPNGPGGTKPPEEITMAQIVQAVKFLANNQKTIGDQLNVLVAQRQAAPPQNSGGATPPTAQAKDIEQMSRAEFGGFLVDVIKRDLIAPLQSNVLQSRQSEVQKKTEAEVLAMSKQYDNFWDFQEEIKAVYSEHPNLSVEDAFTLAQKRSPEKVAQYQQKAAEVAAATKQAEETTRAQEYGGLMPTSSRPDPSAKPMEQAEAVEDAWDKHMTPFVQAGLVNPN